jgi:hypothetical protein
MKEDTRMLTAIRLNNQKRGLNQFLLTLKETTGLALTAEAILPADESVRIEQLWIATINQRLGDASLIRESELAWQDVEQRLLMYCRRIESARNSVILSHHSDFIFEVDLGVFASIAKHLIEFDGDSLYVVGDDCKHGFGVDLYTSELAKQVRYSVDVWGLAGGKNDHD